jgi:hypothetical protein
MSVPGAWPQVLDFFGTLRVVEPSPGHLCSNAGLLPVRQFDQRIGLTRPFADALDHSRDPALIAHTYRKTVRSRVYGMLAGHEVQNDHSTLGIGLASNWSRAARPTLANWPGSSWFPSLTMPLKRQSPRRRGPCALRSETPT